MNEIHLPHHAASALYVVLVIVLTGILVRTAGAGDQTAPLAAGVVALLSVLIVLWVREP
ncbi:MAG TPA: hypothetical protein VFB58_15320 [Chloroflexota bacterium]|nr:hypothetical protein [Chloroflexota bacterium]